MNQRLRNIASTSLKAAWDNETRNRPNTRIRTIPYSDIAKKVPAKAPAEDSHK